MMMVKINGYIILCLIIVNLSELTVKHGHVMASWCLVVLLMLGWLKQQAPPRLWWWMVRYACHLVLHAATITWTKDNLVSLEWWWVMVHATKWWLRLRSDPVKRSLNRASSVTGLLIGYPERSKKGLACGMWASTTPFGNEYYNIWISMMSRDV